MPLSKRRAIRNNRLKTASAWFATGWPKLDDWMAILKHWMAANMLGEALKLGSSVPYGKGITALHKRLTLDAHCTCRAGERNKLI